VFDGYLFVFFFFSDDFPLKGVFVGSFSKEQSLTFALTWWCRVYVITSCVRAFACAVWSQGNKN